VRGTAAWQTAAQGAADVLESRANKSVVFKIKTNEKDRSAFGKAVLLL
jgi:hypothetical protein